MTETPRRSLGAATATEKTFRTPPPDPIRRRWRGCLLGGAVGDALGAPVEFMSLAEIHERFGPAGIVDYTTAFDRPGSITDDTQMTLFTAEGLAARPHQAIARRQRQRRRRSSRMPTSAG